MIRKLLAETFEVPEDDPKVEKALETLHKCLHIDIKRTEVALRNEEIYEMRASGKTIRQIREKYNLSRQYCHLIVKKELVKRRG